MTFCVSLLGFVTNMIVPGNEREVVISEYNSKGWLEVSSYSRPKLSLDCPVFFQNIIESLKMSYEYRLEYDDGTLGRRDVTITVILSDQNGKWKKRFPLSPKSAVSGNDSIIPFDLDIGDLFDKANGIESELDPKFDPKTSGQWMIYGLEIEARADGGDVPEFISLIKGKLGYKSLEWETLFEEYFRGLGYWEISGFSYDVELKDNRLFTSQKNILDLKAPEKLSSDTPLIVGSVEASDAVVYCSFASDIPVEWIKINGVAELEIISPNKWSHKAFSIPFSSNDVSMEKMIPVDVDYILEMVRKSDVMVDLKSSPSIEMRLSVKADVEAAIAGNSIKESISFNELKGRIESNHIMWDMAPVKMSPGKVIEIKNIFSPTIAFIKEYSFIPFFICLIIIVFMAVSKIRSRPEPDIFEREKRKRKRYKGLFVEVLGMSQFTEAEDVLSLEDLVSIADSRGVEIRYCSSFTEGVVYWIELFNKTIRFKAV